MANPQIDPKRGEIWQINFNPQVGSEIQKKRPAIVLDHGHSALPVRIVTPITAWKASRDEQNPFKVYIQPTQNNGLIKECAADSYQIKTVSLERFISKLGSVSEGKTDEVAEAVALAIDMPSLGPVN